MKNTIAAFILLLLVAVSSGGRTNRLQNECQAKCSGTVDTMFKVGESYTYLYHGQSDIETNYSTYDSTGLLVKSKVTITGLSTCQMKLTMTDVEILDKVSTDGNKFRPTHYAEEAKKILELNEVLFSRSNDQVASVCVNKNDPIWSQNLKKSIIDMLANNGNENTPYEQKTLWPTRHGNCYIQRMPSEPKSEAFQYDIKSCTSSSSQSLFTDLAEAVIFEVSRVDCRYTKDTQIVQCSEEYITAPLKEKGNQIKVKVASQLVKTETKLINKEYPKIDKYLIKTGIQMENDPGEYRDQYYLDAKETFKQLVQQHVASKRSEIPKTFMTLINQLKKLNSPQIKEMYLSVLKFDSLPGQNEAIRRMFYDAIGFVNTPAATSVMVDLIKKKQISDIDETVWFTSLSFMKTTPTIEMIKDLETLLQSGEVNKQMYLGISAVTQLYCRQNYESCLMDPTIRNILSFFMKSIGKDCSAGATNENLSNILISLKSLGNLKLFNEDVVSILTKCVSTDSNPIAIKVSALEVLKHMGCDKDRSVAMKILENNENDSELRINSYLTVMGCPDINTMFKIRDILAKEKVNQVGSFIWTHLTNIQESDDRLKYDIQKLLNDVELKNEFDISKLKFSRNIEKTFSTDRFGMTFDSNVIFSEKSFVPRSLSVNTTATVLGRPTNFIEISARMEGFDELLFKLLGPEGYLKKKDAKNSAEDNMKLIKMLEEVNGNLNFKMFGQQISFVELIRGSLSSVKKYNIIEEMIKLGEGQSMEFQKNLMLLDSLAIIPTSLGFPIKLKVQGSVAVVLKMKSKLDITGLMKWPISLNIETNIVPSIMSEFTSELTMETPFSSYGMSMNLKSGTDTEFNALITANKNEEFNVKFDTPKNKQEIVTMSGKSVVIYRGKEIEQMANKIKKFELCTQEKMVRILGVRVCANAEMADAETRKTAILYGPFAANIYIEKVDTQTSYILKGSYKTVPFISESGIIYYSRFLKFKFDTPDSEIYYRRFELEFSLDFQENDFKLELNTPWNQALFQTKFKFTEEQKKVLLLLEMDKKKIAQIGIEHQSQYTLQRRIERGLLVFRIMDLKPFETSWEFLGKKDEWNVKFVSKGLLKDNTYLKLNVKEVKSTRELALSNKYQLSGSYETYFGKGHISGVANTNYYGHRWDVTVKHSSRENPKGVYMIKYSHKTEDKSSQSLRKYFLTSTISYGESAENFIKFKVENELSLRHVRTSIKTSYGIKDSSDSKSSGEIDLQLYGGYSWKEDQVHSAEGSLSFKFPNKGINYEGRYNSEVGKRIFKVAIDLDENQKSKVNLKINYLQPKLYLKDTEFDVLLSFAGHSTNINWGLQEVDVNKYKYSFLGKYNNHALRIDGVQTEISRFKYDSLVQISMPKLKYLPEKINIDLRVDFVNINNGRLTGKIEAPNTNFKYSLDLKFSAMPQNFLQLSSTEKGSVFSYTVEVANVDRKISSESIFTCNPEEVQVFFNFAWNTQRNQQVTFDFHTSHKSPNNKQFISTALIALKYPGNSHSIGFKSNFKYTELDTQIDIIWNRKQKISIITTYEIDDNWTEKGIKGGVTVKTPFTGFESSYLGINAIGQLRYRKVEIEFKWAGNKKILFDIVIQPRSSNDFTMTSKVVTPFHGLNLISFQAVHIITKNSIKSEVSFEMGPSRRYNIKFEGMNNSEGNKRDYGSTLQIESGIFQPIKVSFMHKDDRVHFNSQFDVVWKTTESINVKSVFSYSLEDRELTTKGEIELFSTIEAIKHMKATWMMENRESTFLNNVQLYYKSKNLFHNSIKGYFENEVSFKSFKMDFTGFMKILSNEPYKVTNSLSYELDKIVSSLSLTRDSLQVYSHNINVQPSEITMKMLVVDSAFKTVEFKFITQINGKVQTSKTWMKIGEKYFFKRDMTLTIVSKDYEGNSQMEQIEEFYSDFLDKKLYTTKAKYITTRRMIKFQSETTSKSSLILKYEMEVRMEEKNSLIKLLMQTNWDNLSRFEFEVACRRKSDEPNNYRLKLNYNDVINVKAEILIRSPKIDIDFLYKYGSYARYFKLKYDRPLMGYEQLFETNIFGTTIKVVSSLEARGGISFLTTLTFDTYYMKSINIFGQFSRRDHKLDIVYTFGKHYNNGEVMKVSYSRKSLVYNLHITSRSLLTATAKLNLNQLKKFYFEFKTLNKQNIQDIDIKIDYEGGFQSNKHLNLFKINIAEWKFNLENKLEKVKLSYLLVESKLTTNIPQLSNYKVGFEYKQRPSTYEIEIKGFINERFVTLITKHITKSDWKSIFRIETSFPMVREIIFDIKHKQNKQLTQVSHSCEISLKSNDRKFEMKNKVEWSSTNYIEIQSSIVARTSQDNYLIKPKSFKFIHQYLKEVLKESIDIQISDTIKFKGLMELPMEMQSRALLEIAISKRFKVEIALDGTDYVRKSMKLYLEKDMKKIAHFEAILEKGTNKFLLGIKLEAKGSHASEIEYTSIPQTSEQVRFQLTSTMLPEVITIKLIYDQVQTEGGVTIDGVGGNTMTLTGKMTKQSTKISLKYNEQFATFDFLYNDQMLKFGADIQAGNRMALDFKILSNSLDAKFVCNDNVVKFQGILGKKIELDFKIMDKVISTKFEIISTSPYKFELKGKSNFPKWSTFTGEIYLVNGPENFELTSRLSKEDIDMYNIIIRRQLNSFDVKYESIFDAVKSGKFSVSYDSNSKQLSLKFAAETINSNKINIALKIDENSLEGKISTPLKWMKEVKVKGDLQKSKDSIEGYFDINYEEIQKSLKGKLSYKTGFSSWELHIETPLSKPLDKISLLKRIDNEKISLELRDGDNLVMLASLDGRLQTTLEVAFELNTPKQWTDIQISFNTLLDLENVPNRLVFKFKSNFLQEINLEATVDPIKLTYQVTLSHPTQKGSVSLKLSRTKSSLKSEYNGKTTSIDVLHEIDDPYTFNGKIKIYSNMYLTSPMNLEVSCKHVINIPQNVLISFQTKWNEKTSFSVLIDWKQSNSNNFELISQLLLAPYKNEYKSSLVVVNKDNTDFSLKYSPLSSTMSQDITIKFITKSEEMKLLVTSPYEIIRTVDVRFTTVKSANLKNTLTLNSNYFGQFELTKIYQRLSPSRQIETLRLSSPYTYGNFELNSEYQTFDYVDSIMLKVRIPTGVFQATASRNSNLFKFEINSPHEFVKNLLVVLEQNANEKKVSLSYNEHQIKLDVRYSPQDVQVDIKTTFEMAKLISLTLSKGFSFQEGKTKQLYGTFQKDDRKIKVEISIGNSQLGFKWENDLIPFVSSNLQGNFKYSQSPFNVAAEVSKDSQSLLKVLLNGKELQFHITHQHLEFKIEITKSRFEIIVLNSKLFSLLITQSSLEQIDVAIILKETQYSGVLKFVNDTDNLYIKTVTYVQSLHKTFEFYVDIKKNERGFDLEMNILGKPMLKLKMSDKTTKSRKISTEIRFVHYVTGIVDLEYFIQRNVLDYKLFWNFKSDNTEFTFGSITSTLKRSTPVAFSLNANLASGAYLLQLVELDNKQLEFKIQTPFKEINVEISFMYMYVPSDWKFLVAASLKNELLGDYSVECDGDWSRDPQFRIKFNANKLFIKSGVQIVTSKPGEYSLISETKLFDWEKIELIVNLKTRKGIKLIFSLKTPFLLMKEISMEKTLWMKSVLEHKFQTVMVYKGVINVKYNGGHQISYLKREIRFNGHVETDDLKMISIILHGTKKEQMLDHGFILDVKERRYGYRINGKFKPTFEGITEVYTPFHNSGVLVLQGRQSKNGIKIQAGKDKKEVVAFEYSSTKDVSFVKITPPNMFGRPMAARYRIRRNRRSVPTNFETNIKYGDEEVLKFDSKLNSETKKKMLTLKMSLPKFTTKSAELQLMRQENDGTTLFNHHLKIKDVVEDIYKVFGEYFHKDLNNFRYNFNVHHPYSGPFHFSAGHIIKENTHHSNSIIRLGNKIIFLHKGKLMFEAKKINGELEIKVPNRHYQLDLAHSGDFDQFQQSLTSLYNTEPFISYKANVVPQKTSTIEIDLAILNKKKIKLLFDRIERKVGVNFKIDSDEYLLEMIDKDSKLTTMLQLNNELMASFVLGYASNALSLKAKYLKKYVNAEIILKDALIAFKLTTSCPVLETVHLRFTKNKVALDATYYKAPVAFSLEYHFIPNNFFVVIETSLQRLSKVALYMTATEIKANFNDYFQIFHYKLTKNTLMIDMKNNFCAIRSLVFLAELNQSKTKATSKLQVNDFNANFAINHSENKLTIEFNNNRMFPKTMQVELSRQLDKTQRYWMTSLTIQENEVVKLFALISESKYSMGLKTSLGASVAMSFDGHRNELIIGTKLDEKYLNVIARTQKVINRDAISVLVDASIDSYTYYLHKASSQLNYTTTKSDIFVSIAARLNEQRLYAKTEMTNKNFESKVNINDQNYSIHILRSSDDEIRSVLTTPHNKLNINIKRENNLLSFGVLYNDERILKIDVSQNRDLSKQLEHSSMVWYREQKVWDFTFKTNFKVYEIKFNEPYQVEIVFKNEINEKGRTVSIWTKRFRFLENGITITYNLAPTSRLLEVSIENTYHTMKVSKQTRPELGTEVSVMLLNKQNNKQWEMTIRKRENEEFEIRCKTPETKQGFKYHQIVKNGVKTFVNVEILNKINLLLKVNEKTNILSGELRFIGKKIAQIESSTDKIRAIINEEGPEKHRITLEWTSVTRGEWKKNYISTKRLLVKQEAMNINLDIEQEIKMESYLSSIATKAKYMNIDGSLAALDIAASVDYSVADTLIIEFKNPVIPMKSVLKRAQPDKSTLRYDFETIFNTADRISGTLELSVGSVFGVTSRLFYNPGNRKDFVQIHAKYLDERQLEWRIFGESGKETTDYFQFLVRLLNEHNLEMTLTYKSDSFQLLSSQTRAVSMRFDENINEYINDQSKYLSKESRKRFDQIYGIFPGFNDIREQAFGLQEKVRETYVSFFAEIKSIMYRNEFYFMNIARSVESTFIATFYISADFYFRVKHVITSVNLDVIYRYIFIINCRVRSMASRVAEKITNPMKALVFNMVNNYFPGLSATFIELIESARNFISDASLYIGSTLNRMVISRNAFIMQQTMSFLERLTGFFKQTFGYLADGSMSFMYQEQDIKEIYMNVIRKLEFFMKILLDRAVADIDGRVYSITGERYCEKLRKLISGLTDYVIAQLKDESNQRFVKGLILKTVEESFSEINNKISSFVKNLIIPRYIIVDKSWSATRVVKYSLMVTSPIPLTDIKSIPDFTYVQRKIDEIRNILNFIRKMTREKVLSGARFVAFLRWFSPQLPIYFAPSFMPDFESYATILGSSVVTFDKGALKLQSHHCRVVLAKDMRSRKWDIVLQQTGNGRVYTLSIGNDKVSISMIDSKVSLNGKQMELPLSISATKINAFGSILKVKNDVLGLTITVDPVNDMFTVGLSGWYHGKVRGLFGTNDNEPFNDMLNDNGKLMTTEEFFRAYSDGGQVCRVENDVQIKNNEIENCPFLRKVACKFLYQCPFSPMAPCFSTVNPDQFFKSCISSSDVFDVKMDNSICQSARQYQTQCSAAGIKVPVPLPCRKCEISGNKMVFVNELTTLKIKEKVADMVFVLDEGKCLKSIEKSLEKIISKMDQNLREKGITSTRFGLVTFRGDGIDEAHSHTINQRLFGTKQELLLSIKSLKSTEQSSADIVGAIRLAASYPFREHASKHMILINCGNCDKSSSREFSSLTEMLENNAIQFSMLMDFNFQVKNTESKKMIFGVDSKKIYTTLAWRGETSAVDVVRPSYDFCYDLTMKRGGVAFDINYLIKKTNNDATRKRFVDSFITQVTMTATPARSTVCKCHEDRQYSCMPLDTYAIFPIKKST